MTRRRSAAFGAALVWATGAACSSPAPAPPAADLILTNARAYTMTWADPAVDGTPADGAPYADGRWHPDAAAVAISGDRIVAVGSADEVATRRGPSTTVVDLGGAALVPGLVDSHSHILELG